MAVQFQLHPHATHLNLHPVIRPPLFEQHDARLLPPFGEDRHLQRHVVRVRVGGQAQHKVPLHVGLAQIEPRRFPQAFHRHAQIAPAVRVAVGEHLVRRVGLREIHLPADGEKVLDAHALANHKRPALRVVLDHRVVFAQHVAFFFLHAQRQIVDVLVHAASRRAVHPVHPHAHRLIQRVAAEHPQRASVVKADAALRQVKHARPVRLNALFLHRAVRAVGLRDRKTAGVCTADFKNRPLLHRQQIPAEGFQRNELVPVPRRLIDHPAADLRRFRHVRPFERVVGARIEDAVRVSLRAHAPNALRVPPQLGEFHVFVVLAERQRLALYPKVASIDRDHPVLFVGKNQNVHRRAALHGLVGHKRPYVALVSLAALHPAFRSHRVGVNRAACRRHIYVRVVRPGSAVKPRQRLDGRAQRRKRAARAVAGSQKPPLRADVLCPVRVVRVDVRVACRLINPFRRGNRESPLIVAV